MDLNLKGRNALVCGSTQGIGKAAALELAQLGARIILVARNEERLKETLGELNKISNLGHEYIVADFNFPDVLKQKVNQYASGKTLHILVNNTGGPPAGTVLDADPSAFVSAFSNHLVCSQILVQALVPGMKEGGFGRIINIISTSVRMPIRGLGVSNTIRGAMGNWAKTLSFELGPFGITVNNVLPGTTMTGRLDSLIRNKAELSGKTYEAVKEEMVREIPAGRISEPYEVAAAVAFLASPAAGYINGINIPVDGGRLGCY